jgi:hypothetical protein
MFNRWASGVCNLFAFQNSKMSLSENEVYPKIIQNHPKSSKNHHFQAGLMMINHWIHGFPQNSQTNQFDHGGPNLLGQGSTLAGRRSALDIAGVMVEISRFNALNLRALH